MIDESSYWKDDLLKQAEALRARKQQRRWLEASFARLEQTVMLGFYSIRKLVEARQVSNATFEQQIPVTTYPWSGKTVTRMNWHRLDELYDLDAPTNESRNVLFLCNQIVHSYVFSPVFDDTGLLDSILFTSDRHRHQSLYCLDVGAVIGLFDQAGRDYPNHVAWVFDADDQDYQVTAEMRAVPADS